MLSNTDIQVEIWAFGLERMFPFFLCPPLCELLFLNTLFLNDRTNCGSLNKQGKQTDEFKNQYLSTVHPLDRLPLSPTI